MSKLSPDVVCEILRRAARFMDLDVWSEGDERPDGTAAVKKEVLTYLANICDGDARLGLGSIPYDD